MNIQTTDAQGLYTKKLVDAYRERVKPTAFLRSFFPSVETSTLEVSIEVQRNAQNIAADVMRGSDGNRNQWDRSTEKIFIPPYFKEYLDITNLQLYDRLFGATEISDAVFAQFINDSADKVMMVRETIERAYEKQCADVLLDGIITPEYGVAIDFKRKAGSLVDLNAGGGGYFAANSNVFAQLQAGCNWLRQNGKTGGHTFNCILGETAITNLFANTVFLARQNFFNMKLDTVLPPQKNSLGGVYHGSLTAGPYTVHIWSYPETYEVAGVATPYIHAKKFILLPENTKFKMAFAAVPQLIKPGQPIKTGAIVIREYTNEEHQYHKIFVESAGLAIPTAVDQIYTAQAVA